MPLRFVSGMANQRAMDVGCYFARYIATSNTSFVSTQVSVSSSLLAGPRAKGRWRMTNPKIELLLLIVIKSLPYDMKSLNSQSKLRYEDRAAP